MPLDVVSSMSIILLPDLIMPESAEGYLLQEQARAVKEAAVYVSMLRRVGKGHGTWHFDRLICKSLIYASSQSIGNVIHRYERCIGLQSALAPDSSLGISYCFSAKLALKLRVSSTLLVTLPSELVANSKYVAFLA